MLLVLYEGYMFVPPSNNVHLFFSFPPVCLIGNDWCTSSIRSHCVYSSIAPGEIYGDIGLKVGLKSLNVTLIGR